MNKKTIIYGSIGVAIIIGAYIMFKTNLLQDGVEGTGEPIDKN